MNDFDTYLKLITKIYEHVVISNDCDTMYIAHSNSIDDFVIIAEFARNTNQIISIYTSSCRTLADWINV